MQLTIQYDESSVSFVVDIRLGRAQGVALGSNPQISIPDADVKGVEDTLEVSSTGRVSEPFKVGISIKHSYRGDLKSDSDQSQRQAVDPA